jgi:hypothetical protein
MNFINYSLSSSIPANESIDSNGNWVEFPGYNKILWPFIEKYINNFNKIYLFNNENSTLYQWFIKKYFNDDVRFENNVFELRNVDITNNKILEFLHLLTSHNGYLNTVYVSSDIELLIKFVELFPKPYRIGYSNDNLGLSNKTDNINFRKLLDKINEDSYGITTLYEETMWSVVGSELIIKQLVKNLS